MALDLGKQIGPLPLGAWVGVVGGGLIIGWYFSKGTAKSDKAATAGDNTQVPLTDPGVGAGGDQFIYSPPTQVTPQDSNPTTNDEWGRQAKTWLVATRGADPGVATTAIDKFLQGLDRTLVEQALVNLALIEFGQPPESVPIPENPVPQVPSVPVTPTPAKPKAWTYYRTVKGDTPGKISAKVGVSWWTIYVNNDKIGLRPDGTPGVLSGSVLSIPVGVLLLIPTKESGLISTVPASKSGLPPRYYTVTAKAESVTAIAAKFHVHPWNVFTANDVVGLRADGTKGFLTTMTAHQGNRLIIPYQ